MKTIYNYFLYLLKSKNLHGIHSPFVYNLVKDVIYNKSLSSSKFKEVESLRRRLYRDTRILDGKDYGAGSLQSAPIKTIGQFAKSSSKSKKYACLLYRLAAWHQPKMALELGSAVGISTIYQRLGFPESTSFISLEGNAQLLKIAHKNVDDLHLPKVSFIEGNFDSTLPELLKSEQKFDWIFFDGNHQKKPTLNYFEWCLIKASENALFIFDDINWSEDMNSAWQYIKQHKDVYLTIDLFFIGLVFLKKREQKEHFTIRF